MSKTKYDTDLTRFLPPKKRAAGFIYVCNEQMIEDLQNQTATTKTSSCLVG